MGGGTQRQEGMVSWYGNRARLYPKAPLKMLTTYPPFCLLLLVWTRLIYPGGQFTPLLGHLCINHIACSYVCILAVQLLWG